MTFYTNLPKSSKSFQLYVWLPYTTVQSETPCSCASKDSWYLVPVDRMIGENVWAVRESEGYLMFSLRSSVKAQNAWGFLSATYRSLSLSLSVYCRRWIEQQQWDKNDQMDRQTLPLFTMKFYRRDAWRNVAWVLQNWGANRKEIQRNEAITA